MSRIVEYAGLKFTGGYSVPYMRKTCRSMAGLLYAMLDLRNEGVVYKGGVVRAAANHGLVTDRPREVTPAGEEWLATYRGDIAMREEVIRDAPMPTYTRKERIAKGIPPKTHKPKTIAPAKPNTTHIARDLVAAGLIFVHPSLIDALGAEELALWLKAKRHERENITVVELASMLGETVAVTRLRIESIESKGYTVAVKAQDAA